MGVALEEALSSIRMAIALSIPDIIAILIAGVIASMIAGIYTGLSAMGMVFVAFYAALMMATSLWPSLILALSYLPTIMLILRGFKSLSTLVNSRMGYVGAIVITTAYSLWLLNSIIVTLTNPTLKPIFSLPSILSRLGGTGIVAVIPLYVPLPAMAAAVLGIIGLVLCSITLIKVGEEVGHEVESKASIAMLFLGIFTVPIPPLSLVLILAGLWFTMHWLRVPIIKGAASSDT